MRILTESVLLQQSFPEIIEENSNLPSGDQVKLITRALKEFQEGKEITDDMTVIILKRR